MNKMEMLKKQAQTNTTNLYLSNESIDKEESKNISNEVEELTFPIKNNKMLSFRVTQDIVDNIDKYAYVQRMKKKDLIIMIFDSFFENDKAKEILKQYDNIKGNK